MTFLLSNIKTYYNILLGHEDDWLLMKVGKIHWPAVCWGLFYLLGMVIIMKLVEGIVFSSLPYDSRGVGRFLSRDEYLVQGYSPIMLCGYILVHTLKIALPCYLTATVAGDRATLHATLVVLIGTVISWLLFQAIVQAPISELAGLGFSLLIAALTAKSYDYRRSRSGKSGAYSPRQ